MGDVDPTEGTGIVHIAPGCGREDYELSQKIELPRISPVDDHGNFLEGFDFLTGKNAQEVADEIVEVLKNSNKLLFDYMHEHSYPICWRCKHELIFRLVDEWFISSDEIRPNMIKAAAEVEWQPEFIGKRMTDWLTNMGDWCISRKRFWGLPLPFYPCSCGELTVIGSINYLKEHSDYNVDDLPELHKPWIDDIRINCPKCGNKVSRVKEVGDCWLDAGIVPYSTRGYFEDKLPILLNIIEV